MIKHKKPGKHFIRGQLGFHKKFVMPGKADVLPVTVTGSYAKLGHFWLRQFPHSGYVPVTAEAEQAYQVEHYPLCGASPVRVAQLITMLVAQRFFPEYP
jgi:hypothetical protein